jgi:class 3 adenylate cyclase
MFLKKGPNLLAFRGYLSCLMLGSYLLGPGEPYGSGAQAGHSPFHRYGGVHDVLGTIGRRSRFHADAQPLETDGRRGVRAGWRSSELTGDGIMAVFGAPVALEDAPLRACRAALSILKRLKTDGPAFEIKHGVRPYLRIGLNTGTAVVGKVQGGADARVTVLGDTVNFAARLQTMAEPDSILMSEATHRLVQGMVEARFAGEHSIKGKSEPQKVFRLDGVRPGATRFEAAMSRGLSTFVGREQELEVLERGLTDARSEFCVIDIAAEPGMGKSRLLHEFRQRIGKERAFVLSGNCSPDGQQTPFLPFIEVVRGSFRVSLG